jgi:hypothetical protein
MSALISSADVGGSLTTAGGTEVGSLPSFNFCLETVLGREFELVTVGCTFGRYKLDSACFPSVS